MTPIPSLPTDNLYKFVALVGFFLSVGSAAAPTLIRYQRQNYENQIEVERDERFRKYLELQLKLMDGDPALRDPAARHAAQQKFTSDLAEEQRATAAWKIERRKRASESWVNVSKITLVVGLLMSLVGFPLWFTRVQRLQDRLLAMQLEKERAKPREKAVEPPPGGRRTRRDRRRW